MTDNEIIRALECCADEMGCIKGCPCFNPKAKGSSCTVSKKLELEKLTLDLIKRQQAEIEEKDAAYNELMKVTKLWEAYYNNAQIELVELRKIASGKLETTESIYPFLTAFRSYALDDFRKQRTEAVKEFGEKVKEIFIGSDEFDKTIDDLVKEMVGE